MSRSRENETVASGTAARLRITLAAGLIALAALLFPASALALHEYEEFFGPDGTEATVFENHGEQAPVIGVDSASGDIYVGVGSTQTIYKFNENHQPADFSALGSSEITGVNTGFADGTRQLAVDATSHRFYVTGGASFNSISAFQASGEPVEFSALGGANEITGFTQLCGLAVDGNGDIYAGDTEANKVTIFAPSGAELTSFTAPHPCNLAVDSSGAPYVDHVELTTQVIALSVEKFTPSAFPVTGATTYTSAGQVDPGPAFSLAVNPATDHLYVDRRTKVLEYDSSGAMLPPPFGESGERALERSVGIAARGAGLSERIYVSDVNGSPGANGRIQIYGPTLEPPQVATGSASEVKKTTATLNGTLNPKGTPIISCSFEYVTDAAYQPAAQNPYAAGQSAPCDSLDGAPISGPGEIPVDSNDHLLGATPSGLTPNTTYHFRFVAANASASARGDDETFETFGPPVISVELASEVTTNSALISASIDPRGETTTFAVQYVTQAQFGANEYAEATTVPVPHKAIGSGVGEVEVSQELSGLSPDTTYHFRLVAENSVDPAVDGADLTFATFPSLLGLPDSRAYEMVSPQVKSGEVFAPDPSGYISGSCRECMPDGTKMPMQPSADGSSIAYEAQAFGPGTAAERNEYLAARGAGGWATEALSGPQYHANAPSILAGQGEGYIAFSSDLSRGVISQVKPSLSPQAPPDYANLYRWQRGGALQPVLSEAPPHRLPGGDPASSLLVIYGGANSGTPSAEPFSHIAFEANDALTAEVAGIAPAAPEVGAEEHDLYESVGDELRLVNVLPGNSSASPNAVIGSGRLLLASSQNEVPDFDHAISDDGSRIFWSDKASEQLYVRIDGAQTREIPGPGVFLTAATDGSKVLLDNGHIYDLQAESTADLTAGQGGFKGILGAAEDLSRVYFVDSAVLSGTEENANEEAAEAGKDNLYLWDEGAIVFIGRLLPGDNQFRGNPYIGDWNPTPSKRIAQVSPDGRYLAFMSAALLTSYDNTKRDGKVCVAGPACSQVFEYDANSAKLACASCNPTNERPLGYSNLSLIEPPTNSVIYAPPENLTANGRLFFESQDTLSVGDENGHIQDVYEWEPQGIGSCKRAGGCISLISSGQSPNDTHFLNATPSGGDAFFVTREQLLARDKDDFMDLYDARVGGGIEENPTPPCGGEACRGAIPPAPASQSPGSASFSGPGNEVQKPKKKHKQKKHKKQKKHSKRGAKHNRGGSK